MQNISKDLRNQRTTHLGKERRRNKGTREVEEQKTNSEGSIELGTNLSMDVKDKVNRKPGI